MLLLLRLLALMMFELLLCSWHASIVFVISDLLGFLCWSVFVFSCVLFAVFGFDLLIVFGWFLIIGCGWLFEFAIWLFVYG